MQQEHLGSCTILARLAADQDHEATWVALVDRHGQSLYRIAYSILDDANLAEDAVQEALLYIRDHVGDFHPTSPIADLAERQADAWIKRIVCTAALQQARSRAIHRKHSLRFARQAATGTADQESNALETDAESSRALRQALHELPERHRQVLALHYFGGLEHSQLAVELQCSVGACRVRLHRALKALRRRLQQLGIAFGLLALASRLEAAARVARAAAGSWHRPDEQGWYALLRADRQAHIDLTTAVATGWPVGSALILATVLLAGGAWFAAGGSATTLATDPTLAQQSALPSPAKALAVPASTPAETVAAIEDTDPPPPIPVATPLLLQHFRLQHGPYRIRGSTLSDHSIDSITVQEDETVVYQGALDAQALAAALPEEEVADLVAAVEAHLATRLESIRRQGRPARVRRAVDGSLVLETSDGEALPLRLQVGPGGFEIHPHSEGAAAAEEP